MSPTQEFSGVSSPMSFESSTRVEFFKQPSQEFRFRYLSEFKKGSHGCLKNDRGKGRKDGGCPEIRTNLLGAIQIEVGLYTAGDSNRKHVHKLVEGSKTDNPCGSLRYSNDKCICKDGWNHIELKNMNILHVGKDEVDKFIKNWYLSDRDYEQSDFDKFPVKKKKICEDEMKELKREVENNVVLGVTLLVDDIVVCGPVFSNKISNTKTVKKLNIEDISKASGSCRGGDDVFILCEKLRLEDIDKLDPEKSDIAVEFYECSDNPWTARAKIVKIHHQSAIIFETPPYRNTNLRQPIEVSMRLIRKSDNETSDSRKFIYEPVLDDYNVNRKRLKTTHNASDSKQNNDANINTLNNTVCNTKNENDEEAAANSLLSLSRGGTPADEMDADENNVPDVGDLLRLLNDELNDEELEDYGPDFQISNDEEQPLQPNFANLGEIVVADIEGDAARNSPLLTSNDPLMSQAAYYDKNDDYQLDSSTVEEQMDKLKISDGDVGTDKTQSRSLESEIKSSSAYPSTANNTKTKSKGELLAYKLALQTARYLHSYACTGNVNILIMSMRHLIGLQDEYGDNAIHASVLNSQFSALKSLLEVARTIVEYNVLDICNNLSQSPLHIAVHMKQEKIINLLLNYGANPNRVDRNGNMAIHLAALQDTDICLKALLNTIEYTTKYKSNKPQLDAHNFAGYTPLHLAVLKNCYENVTRLCFAGCNVNKLDYTSGRSALHMAVEQQNTKIVTFLLQNFDADPDVHMFNGNTPLHLAVMQDHVEIVQLLMQAKADPYLENNESRLQEDEPETSNADAIKVRRRGTSSWDLVRSRQVRCLLKNEPIECTHELEENNVLVKETRGKEFLDSGIGLSGMSCSSVNDLEDEFEEDQPIKLLVNDVELQKEMDSLLNHKNWEDILNCMGKKELFTIIKEESSPTLAVFKLFSKNDIKQLIQILNNLEMRKVWRILCEKLSL